MRSEEVPAFLAASPLELEVTGDPERLTGGLMNRVWRVPATPASVIVKHAPPHVAAAPDIPVDPSRLDFEARALGRVAELFAEGSVHTPRVLHHDPAAHVLVLEDLGEVPDLEALLVSGSAGAVQGAWLGEALARVHGIRDGLEEQDNAPVQATRREVQYEAVAGMLGGDQEAGAVAADLGRRLCRPGRCLVMGDLWPPSVLGEPDGSRLYWIDWEFSHRGRPCQDLGHLLAHLWLLELRGAGAASVVDFRLGFLDRYTRLAPELDEETRRDTSVHMGCEILVRTVGPFQDASFPDVEEAVRHARALILGDVAGPLEGERVFPAAVPVECLSDAELSEVEERMRPGDFCQAGFLGPGESLREVVAADREKLAELGVTPAQVADRLVSLLGQADRLYALRLREGGDLEEYHELGVPVEGRYRVEVDQFLGSQECPFGCTGGANDYRIRREDGDEVMLVGELLPHLIRTHHFFEGSTPYRVDPATAVRLLGIEPGVDYAPRLGEETLWQLDESGRDPEDDPRSRRIRSLGRAVPVEVEGVEAHVHGGEACVWIPARSLLPNPLLLDGAPWFTAGRRTHGTYMLVRVVRHFVEPA